MMALLTYDDLSERWGVKTATLMVWKHRGKLPEPDIIVGQSPAWYEDTIAKLEAQNGHTGPDPGTG